MINFFISAGVSLTLFYTAYFFLIKRNITLKLPRYFTFKKCDSLRRLFEYFNFPKNLVNRNLSIKTCDGVIQPYSETVIQKNVVKIPKFFGKKREQINIPNDKSAISRLQSLYEMMKTENISLNLRLQNVTLRCDTLQTDMICDKDQFNNLLLKHDSLTKKLDLQTRQMRLNDEGHLNMYQLYERKIEQLQEDIHENERKKLGLVGEINIEKIRTNDLKRQLNDTEVRLTEVRKGNEILQEINTSLKRDEESFREECNTLKVHNGKLRRIIDKLGRNIEDRVSALDDMKKVEAVLEDKLSSVNQLNVSILKDVGINNIQFENKIEHLQTEVKVKETEIESLTKTIVELKANLLTTAQYLTLSHNDFHEHVTENVTNKLERVLYPRTRVSSVKAKELSSIYQKSNFPTQKAKSELTLNSSLGLLSDEFRMEQTVIHTPQIQNHQISELITVNKILEDPSEPGGNDVVTVSESSDSQRNEYHTNEDGTRNSNGDNDCTVTETDGTFIERQVASLQKKKSHNFEFDLHFINQDKSQSLEDKIERLKFENEWLRFHLSKYKDCLEKTESVLEGIQNSIHTDNVVQ